MRATVAPTERIGTEVTVTDADGDANGDTEGDAVRVGVAATDAVTLPDKELLTLGEVETVTLAPGVAEVVTVAAALAETDADALVDAETLGEGIADVDSVKVVEGDEDCVAEALMESVTVVDGNTEALADGVGGKSTTTSPSRPRTYPCGPPAIPLTKYGEYEPGAVPGLPAGA